jgi:hypothetical protein
METKMTRKIDFERIKIKLVVETFDSDQETTDTPQSYISDTVVLLSSKDELQRFGAIREKIYNTNFSNDEKKRALNEFWKTATLVLLDSFLDGTQTVDEITGTPGFKFGQPIKD